MNRYYLDKLGVHDRWDKWIYDKKEEEKLKKNKRKYGFDDRETYNLDTTFYQWLYERLVRYKELASKIIDFKSDYSHRWDYKGKSLNQIELIDKAIALLEEYFTTDGKTLKEDLALMNKALEAAQIFVMILPAMWW